MPDPGYQMPDKIFSGIRDLASGIQEIIRRKFKNNYK
jgi:hypothetical protein